MQRIWSLFGKTNESFDFPDHEEDEPPKKPTQSPAVSDNEPQIQNCPICLEPLNTDKKIETLPCTHKIHEECGGRVDKCPYCRKPTNHEPKEEEEDKALNEMVQKHMELLRQLLLPKETSKDKDVPKPAPAARPARNVRTRGIPKPQRPSAPSFETIETGTRVTRVDSHGYIARLGENNFKGVPEEERECFLNYAVADININETDLTLNEELQQADNDATNQPDVHTYKKYCKTYEAFVEKAVKITKTIVDELYSPSQTYQPVKTEGIAGGQKYIEEGIFFKLAMDQEIKDFWMFGRTEASFHKAGKAASAEFKGLQACINVSDLRGPTPIRFPVMIMIDYRGFRMLAMPVLPISTATLKYGSNNRGQSIILDQKEKELHDSIKKMAEKLHLAPHKIHQTNVVLNTPIDLEGHLGTDKKYYLLDFGRLMPPESPTLIYYARDRSVFYRFLRPEFVKSYQKPLSSDAFSIWSDETRQSEVDVGAATKYLYDTVIPQFAAEMPVHVTNLCNEFSERCLESLGDKTWEVFPIKSTPSTKGDHIASLDFFRSLLRKICVAAHKKGINIRHLGELLQRPTSNSSSRLISTELCARIIKNFIRERIRVDGVQKGGNDASIIAGALTKFFGDWMSDINHSILSNALNEFFCGSSLLRHPPFVAIVFWRVLDLLNLQVDHKVCFNFGSNKPFCITEQDILSFQPTVTHLSRSRMIQAVKFANEIDMQSAEQLERAIALFEAATQNSLTISEPLPFQGHELFIFGEILHARAALNPKSLESKKYLQDAIQVLSVVKATSLPSRKCLQILVTALIEYLAYFPLAQVRQHKMFSDLVEAVQLQVLPHSFIIEVIQQGKAPRTLLCNDIKSVVTFEALAASDFDWVSFGLELKFISVVELTVAGLSESCFLSVISNLNLQSISWGCSNIFNGFEIPLTNYGLAQIAMKQQSLRELRIYNAPRINDFGLKRVLVEATELKVLHLMKCDQVLGDPFVHDIRCTLEVLHICGRRIHGAALNHALNTLRKSITDFKCLWNKVSNSEDFQVEKLCFFSKLENLALEYSPDMPVNQLLQVLESIGGNLKSLSLNYYPSISDRVVDAIATYCPQLRSLELCGYPGEADFLAPEYFSDKCLQKLCYTCKELQFLNISNQLNLTKLSFDFLLNLQNLETLRIYKCKKISAEDIGWLVSELAKRNCFTTIQTDIEWPASNVQPCPKWDRPASDILEDDVASLIGLKPKLYLPFRVTEMAIGSQDHINLINILERRDNLPPDEAEKLKKLLEHLQQQGVFSIEEIPKVDWKHMQVAVSEHTLSLLVSTAQAIIEQTNRRNEHLDILMLHTEYHCLSDASLLLDLKSMYTENLIEVIPRLFDTALLAENFESLLVGLYESMDPENFVDNFRQLFPITFAQLSAHLANKDSFVNEFFKRYESDATGNLIYPSLYGFLQIMYDLAGHYPAEVAKEVLGSIPEPEPNPPNPVDVTPGPIQLDDKDYFVKWLQARKLQDCVPGFLSADVNDLFVFFRLQEAHLDQIFPDLSVGKRIRILAALEENPKLDETVLQPGAQIPPAQSVPQPSQPDVPSQQTSQTPPAQQKRKAYRPPKTSTNSQPQTQQKQSSFGRQGEPQAPQSYQTYSFSPAVSKTEEEQERDLLRILESTTEQWMSTGMGFSTAQLQHALLLNLLFAPEALQWLADHTDCSELDTPLSSQVKIAAMQNISECPAPIRERMVTAIHQGICTYLVVGERCMPHLIMDCYTCRLIGENGVCEACALRCHSGHKVSRPKFHPAASCHCSTKVQCVCRPPPPQPRATFVPPYVPMATYQGKTFVMLPQEMLFPQPQVSRSRAQDDEERVSYLPDDFEVEEEPQNNNNNNNNNKRRF